MTGHRNGEQQRTDREVNGTHHSHGDCHPDRQRPVHSRKDSRILAGTRNSTVDDTLHGIDRSKGNFNATSLNQLSAGVAGRGAGDSASSNHQHALAPLNTANAGSTYSAQLTSASSSSSRNSHIQASSSSSKSHHSPQPPSLSLGAPPPPHTASSSRPYASSSSASSPREPQFPPQKQHSGSSVNSITPRSPTTQNPSMSLPPGGASSSRPNSTSGHSASSHGRAPSTEGHASDRERERDSRERQHSRSVNGRGESTPTPRAQQACAKCGLQMTGQFVRALGTVYHLDCFRCQVSVSVGWADCYLTVCAIALTGLQQGRRKQILPYR